MLQNGAAWVGEEAIAMTFLAVKSKSSFGPLKMLSVSIHFLQVVQEASQRMQSGGRDVCLREFAEETFALRQI